LNKTLTEELFYKLNKTDIAQDRYKKAENSKLLIANTKKIIKFKHLLTELPNKSVIVLNKSKLQDVRIKTNKLNTKGKVEIFILRKISENICECLLKYRGTKKVGSYIETELLNFKIIKKNNSSFEIESNLSVDLIISNFGKTPLPPYINDKESKYKYYKTEFEDKGFSVAASTAGLHFDKTMIEHLENNDVIVKYINLDIGLGTFKPINTEYLDNYKIHEENYSVSKKEFSELLKLKNKGYKIISVGTTVLRTLETVANTNVYKGQTSLFIKPGYKFKVVDLLITNFHAPRSTLLSIVLTIYGKKWKELYKYAQRSKLKFLSFGDAVLFEIE